MAEGNSYEVTEPENREIIETFGKEVQLTVFKSNIKESESDEDVRGQVCEQKVSRQQVRNMAIICVGNDSNNWDKMIYIKHYLNKKPQLSDSHRTVGVNLASKELEPNFLTPKRILKLHFVVIGEHLVDMMAKTFLHRTRKTSEIIGVMVFWGPRNPSSLSGAVEWRKRIQEVFPEMRDHLPFLLITDNLSSVKWIGRGKIMETIDEMNAFCRDKGFIKWFEILKSDWRLGEQNDVGIAIDWLLNEALAPEQPHNIE